MAWLRKCLTQGCLFRQCTPSLQKNAALQHFCCGCCFGTNLAFIKSKRWWKKHGALCEGQLFTAYIKGKQAALKARQRARTTKKRAAASSAGPSVPLAKKGKAKKLRTGKAKKRRTGKRSR